MQFSFCAMHNHLDYIEEDFLNFYCYRSIEYYENVEGLKLTSYHFGSQRICDDISD